MGDPGVTGQRIVAVNRFYAPDHSATAQLLTDLAVALVRAGHPVTIVTSGLRYDDARARLPARETLDGVDVRRAWSSRFGRAGLAGRSVDYLTFYVSAFFVLLRALRAGDTVVAETDPPLISIPVAMAARLKGARLVNWCQDLFPETAAALGLGWADGRAGRVLRAVRNWSLRRADLNVALCEPMRRHLQAEGVAPTRIQVVHNWTDDRIRPMPLTADDGVTIAYSGNLGRAHGIAAIIRLIECTHDVPGISWLFIGGGAGTAPLRQIVGERGFTHVTFEPYAPRERLSESLARGDVHLVTLDPACEGLIMPSKLYGVMAAGRPTLFLGSPDGAVAALLREHDAGMTLDSTRTETFAAGVVALIANRDRLAEMGNNARAAFERHYTAGCGMGAWIGLLTKGGVSQPAEPAPISAAAVPHDGTVHTARAGRAER